MLPVKRSELYASQSLKIPFTIEHGLFARDLLQAGRFCAILFRIFDKEGYFQVAASKNEINNMDNYVIAHVIPDTLYKVRFDDELHIRINANKRHGCVEATLKLTEKELGNDVSEGNEFSLKKFACEYNGNSAIRAIDENSGRGWFEGNETT